MCSHTALLSKWDPGLSFTTLLFSLQCPAKPFDSVKWETHSSSEEHFQDGWRCEEVEWRSTETHWPSKAYQHYSPHPPGIVAQVALAHYSNSYGLSLTGKGKYGFLLAHFTLRHAVFVWVKTWVGGCYTKYQTSQKFSSISKKITYFTVNWSFLVRMETSSHYKWWK